MRGLWEDTSAQAVSHSSCPVRHIADGDTEGGAGPVPEPRPELYLGFTCGSTCPEAEGTERVSSHNKAQGFLGALPLPLLLTGYSGGRIGWEVGPPQDKEWLLWDGVFRDRNRQANQPDRQVWPSSSSLEGGSLPFFILFY